MIKRFITALISALCFVLPATANIKIETDAVDAAIREHFQQEKDKASAVATYKANLAEDGSIGAPSIWKVCVAGGLDIKQPAGKTKCQKFISSLIKSAKVSFYEVCGKDKGKAGGVCVTDFKDIQVTITPAITLAKEYVRIKNGDNSLQCYFKPRAKGLQDYVKCTSQNNNVYYEFEFNDVKESFDSTIKWGIHKAVCGIYETEAKEAGSTPGTQYSRPVSWGDSCVADEAKCKKINESMAKFGYLASYDTKNKNCAINFNTVKKAEDLKTAFGIDNFVFCRGIQVQNAPSAESAIKQYIVSAAKKQNKNIDESTIECLSGFQTYTGPGCKVDGWTDYKDDIKTCKVGAEQIDFVFDDVNESWDTYHAGGVSGMNCIASDGSFDGANCRLLGEENCKQLAAALKTGCPECDKPVWDGKTCVLPSAASADKINKSIKIGTEVGVAAIGVALFFVPGGQGAAVAIAVNYVAAGLVITGATVRVASNIYMQTAIYSDFANEVEACHNETCARDLLRKWVQTIQSYKGEFTQAEQKATDELCDHLFNQIPSDSDFWLAFVQDKEVFDPWTCKIKGKKQFWQHMRTAGEVAEIAGALLRVGTLAFEKTTETVVTRTTEKVYAFGNNGKPGIMLRATQEGVAKTTGGSFLNKFGLKYGTAYSWSDAAEIMSKAGLDVNLYRGATWANKAQGLLRLTNGRFASALVKVPMTVENSVVHVTFNMAGMVNPALGTLAETAAETGYFESRTADGYRVPYCMGIKQQEQGVIEIVDIEEDEGKKTVVTPSPLPNPNPEPNHTTPNPLPNSTPETTPDVIPAPVVTPTPIVTPTPVVKPTSDKPTTFTPNKQKNTGLIVGLTAAGLVATGAVVGGVVAATSKNKATKTAVSVADSVDSAMENVMHNANNVLGVVDGKQVTLVPLPTTVNTNAKLVEINKNVVAVVGYDGYKLPYYVKNGNWAPLLGIGETSGHWFNVYPKANTGIKKLDMITNLMNQQINPSVVVRYTSFNAGAFALPLAAVSAFGIINSEFPNGVVQSENMTAQEARLYSDNYELMKNKLK